MNDKLTGSLKYWNTERGFGFVNRVVDGVLFRYFLHASQIIDGEPIIGSTVKFHAAQEAKGFAAHNAEIVPNEYAVKLADALTGSENHNGK